MTMSKYLLDSDVLIWHLRGKSKIQNLVLSLGRSALLSCSVLSVIEIEAGMHHGEEEATRELINSLQIEEVDLPVASLAGFFIKSYRSQGVTLDIVDATIAATAVKRGMVLVTANTKHYPMTEIELLEAKL